MYTVVVILILIVSVLLGLIVLVQNSKGGGLVSNFGGANQMMGVRQTTDFLEKATTWTLGGILVVLCLISSITLPKNSKEGAPKSEVESIIPNLPSAEVPAATTTMPASEEAPAETPAEAPAE